MSITQNKAQPRVQGEDLELLRAKTGAASAKSPQCFFGSCATGCVVPDDAAQTHQFELEYLRIRPPEGSEIGILHFAHEGQLIGHAIHAVSIASACQSGHGRPCGFWAGYLREGLLRVGTHTLASIFHR